MKDSLLALITGAALKGSAVTAAVLLATLLLRGARPALRHALLLAALASFLILPVVALVMPRLSVASPVPSWQPAAGPATNAETPLLSPAGSGGLPAAGAGSGSTTVARQSTREWNDAFLAGWAGGALLLLLRLGIASLGVRRMVGQGVPLGGQQRDRADAAASAILRGRRASFLQARSCTIPLTLGTLRLCVMLPPRIAADGGESFDAILAHELARAPMRCAHGTDRLRRQLPVLVRALGVAGALPASGRAGEGIRRRSPGRLY